MPQATGYRIFENKVYFDNGEKDVLLPLAKADSFQILQQTGWAKDAKDAKAAPKAAAKAAKAETRLRLSENVYKY